MQLKIAPLVVAFVFLVGKATALGDIHGHAWIAPTSTDSRSPCPGLNTLANHGYLPRSGKNITVPEILDAALGLCLTLLINSHSNNILKEAFNLNFDTVLLAAKLGLLAVNDDPSSSQMMTLESLKLHDLIEHDASISRNDFATGDNLHFNETAFSTLANANPGKDYYDPVSAGGVQRDRLAHSIATNPNVTNSHKEITIRSRESAFYLGIFGNPATGVAPKKFVQTFFREERLPIEEGWVKSKTLITAAVLAPLEAMIFNASDWTQSQECEVIVAGN
ncbi:HEME-HALOPEROXIDASE domain-containing protein [Mycena venus]|uniref:HEME-HALOPEROXIDASE domain-containing protein n=1 Tax=Mycena venus TaxID=2733690 RepID=A0A8H6YRT5_9AGAR|nr:HEME-HALOPEROXIDASE domain-containing protein [Mycena venus]